MTSGVLTPGQNGRFYLCLSLAEAETIRRIMHARIGGPLLAAAPGLSLALRCNTNNNAVMDISNRFQQGPAHQLLMAWSALRFLNSETHFSEAALNAVLHAVDDHTPTQRQRFYHQIMGCRRRLRKRVIDTPVQRLFVIPTRFHLLLRRAIAWRIGAAITSTGLSMYDAFRAFDANKNGLLSPDELAGAVRFLRLPALTVDDILDFLSALDPSKEWNMLYKDFTEMLRDPDVPLDEGADQDPEEEETSSDLPEVTPIDTELFKTRMIERRLKEQAELEAEEAAVAGADAAYALRVRREGGGPRAGPDHSDLEAQHKKIYDPVTRVPVKGEVAAAAGADDDEDGVLGDLAENPQVNSTDRTVRWEFANGSLPSLVQPHGPNAEFITETLPDGNESTFLRLGSYTGLKFQLPFPKTVVPSTNYNFAMLVRFRRPEQTVRTRERAEQLAKLKSARAERRAKETPEERAARREEKRKAIIAAHLKAKADARRKRVEEEEKRDNTVLFARRSALYGLPAASMTTDTTRSAATKLEEMKRAGIVNVDDVDDAVTVSGGGATAAATVDDAAEDNEEEFVVKDEDLDSGSDDDEAAQKELDAFEAGRTMAAAERDKAAQTDSNIIPSFSAFLSKNGNSNCRPVPFLRVFQENNKKDSQYDFDLEAVTFNYLNGNTQYNNSRGTRAFKYDEWEIISFSNHGSYGITYESGQQMGYSYYNNAFPLSQSFGLFLSHEREDMRDVDVDIKLVMISMSMSTTIHNVLTAQRRANKLLISVPPKVAPGAAAANAAAKGKGKKTDSNGDVFNATRLMRQYGYDKLQGNQ